MIVKKLVHYKIYKLVFSTFEEKKALRKYKIAKKREKLAFSVDKVETVDTRFVIRIETIFFAFPFLTF
jgi:hypothetical protein